MSPLAAIAAHVLVAGGLFVALWLSFPRWVQRRATRGHPCRTAPWEHARLSRKHKRAWERFKAANADLAAQGASIAGKQRKDRQ